MKKHVLIAAWVLVALPAASRAERKVQGSEQFLRVDCSEDDTLTIIGSQNFERTEVSSTGRENVIRKAGGQ